MILVNGFRPLYNVTRSSVLVVVGVLDLLLHFILIVFLIIIFVVDTIIISIIIVTFVITRILNRNSLLF